MIKLPMFYGAEALSPPWKFIYDPGIAYPQWFTVIQPYIIITDWCKQTVIVMLNAVLTAIFKAILW